MNAVARGGFNPSAEANLEDEEAEDATAEDARDPPLTCDIQSIGAYGL